MCLGPVVALLCFSNAYGYSGSPEDLGKCRFGSFRCGVKLGILHFLQAPWGCTAAAPRTKVE